jgi:glycosyltransferase involved in cell wall biosynthesis
MMAGLTALAGRVLRKPVFTTDAGAGGYGLHRIRDTRSLFAGHLHISDFSRRHFGHEKLPSATVIHGGVNPVRFSPDKHVRRTNEVLFVGRLLPHKGIDYLIDAVQTDIPLRIIGRPFRHAAAYRELLVRMTAGKQVTFDAHCSDADLLNAYRAALCIVLPSVYESVDGQRHVIPELLGLTLLEAMACGTPAICTSVTSLPEIVEDGVSGFVVPPNDPAALRDRILWLRDNPVEAALMGDAARKRAVDHFAWEIAVRECLAAYARASNSIGAEQSDE